jgi:hypothetical protein
MKKQTIVALVLLLAIPVVWILGSWAYGQINPEILARRGSYLRDYHLLYFVKHLALRGSMAASAILWLLVCFLVIRSKERSSWWLFLAAFGPFGFAGLAMLNDRAPAETDRYTRLVRKLNVFARVAYEACAFGIIWTVAFQVMVLKRNLMISYQSATTGVPVAQIIDIRDASSGMWAFGEGLEVMYFGVLLYLLWPAVFNTGSRFWSSGRERASDSLRS